MGGGSGVLPRSLVAPRLGRSTKPFLARVTGNVWPVGRNGARKNSVAGTSSIRTVKPDPRRKISVPNGIPQLSASMDDLSLGACPATPKWEIPATTTGVAFMSNRRQFIKTSAALGIGYWVAGGVQAKESKSPNGKLNVGFVAAGGQAGSHTGAAHGMGLKCICFAEVDETRWNGRVGQGRVGRKPRAIPTGGRCSRNTPRILDVVFVATPDHSHFAPSMTAISMGIHCYTEKPLTWSVRRSPVAGRGLRQEPEGRHADG